MERIENGIVLGDPDCGGAPERCGECRAALEDCTCEPTVDSLDGLVSAMDRIAAGMQSILDVR